LKKYISQITFYFVEEDLDIRQKERM